MEESHHFTNPHPDVDKRDFCGPRSHHYEVMMNFLHSDATKTPRIYYCGTHHSIESVSTYETHRDDPSCQIYTKGQFSGNYATKVLLNLLGKERKDTIVKITNLARDHGHIDSNGKIKMLFFTKYAPQADKIQKKKKAVTKIQPDRKVNEEVKMEAELREECKMEEEIIRPIGFPNPLQNMQTIPFSHSGKILISFH